ncbi:MAG: undecaprenyldiphospho-muramoylpentapeptide beta-N-acetylglucosaminyltransferase [Oscillospiraceae bacterium]|nr:undecaprenyldiphospho-muramoylpentapeptide beta-N-acetylglucosaminyltransferase [Oscillospiraceae bacterium]
MFNIRVLLTGGGTGGHINPALAIADIIKQREASTQFLFAGTPFGMEADLIPKEGYNFAQIKVKGFQRHPSVENLKRNIEAASCLISADVRAKEIITSFKPDIVIGTGGYVSGPVVKRAAKLRIPTAIHEANALPGLTTKILSKYVNAIMLTVPETKDCFKGKNCVVTGLPVRTAFSTKTKEQARKELGLDNNMTVLSFGGSLGAGKINECMLDVINWGKDLDINFIHGFGSNGRKIFTDSVVENLQSEKIKISEYIYNMGVCLTAADLVICRSGASTLAELEAVGRGSILIPSPIVANNHQYYNAKVLEKVGGAVLIEQSELNSDKLIAHIQLFFEQPNKLTAMGKKTHSLYIDDTPKRIYDTIRKIM